MPVEGYPSCSLVITRLQSSVKDDVSSSNAQRPAFVCCYNAAGDRLSMFVLRLIGVLALIGLN